MFHPCTHAAPLPLSILWSDTTAVWRVFYSSWCWSSPFPHPLSHGAAIWPRPASRSETPPRGDAESQRRCRYPQFTLFFNLFKVCNELETCLSLSRSFLSVFSRTPCRCSTFLSISSLCSLMTTSSCPSYGWNTQENGFTDFIQTSIYTHSKYEGLKSDFF